MARHLEDRDIPKSKLSLENLKNAFRLFKYMTKANRWWFALGTSFLAITAAASLMFPKLLGEMMDGALTFNKSSNLQAASPDKIKEIAMGFVYLFIVQAIFSFGRIAIYVRVTEDMTFGLRRDLFKSVIKQDLNFHYQNRVGELMSRFSADVAQIQDAFTTNLAMFIRQILVLIGGVVVLFYSSPKLAWLMLATLPGIIIVALFFGRFIRNKSKEVQNLTASNSIIVEESLSSIQSVKAFTNEQFEISRYTQNTEELKLNAIKRGYWRGAFSSFIIIAMFGAIIWLIYQGLSMVQSGEMQMGELFNFMILTAFVGSSIGGMAEQFVQIQKTLGSIERVLDIIETPGEIKDEQQPTETLNFTQPISMQNVSFAYPSRKEIPILSSINLQINPGDTIALVGPSGAGKSTIASLLYRFYEPENGEILIGNKPINSYSLTNYRSHFALVPQEVLLFGGSIYENILYGKPNASKDEVENAAKMAFAWDFIQSFPDKFNTLVGDRGVRLSGGQKQRIAIARAILRNPDFLILDEATSALDTESEIHVQNALKKLMENRTSLVIAHRLSTIKQATQIVIINHGKIQEIGNHETLMNTPNSLYKRMVEQQINPEEFFSQERG